MRAVSNTIYKNKLKMVQRPKCKTRYYKTPGRKHRQTLFNISHSNIFLDLSPKIKELKANINKGGLIKLKSFCTTRETVNKMKRQSME